MRIKKHISVLGNGIRALTTGHKTKLFNTGTTVGKFGADGVNRDRHIIRLCILDAIDTDEAANLREEDIENKQAQMRQADRYIEQLQSMLQTS